MLLFLHWWLWTEDSFCGLIPSYSLFYRCKQRQTIILTAKGFVYRFAGHASEIIRMKSQAISKSRLYCLGRSNNQFLTIGVIASSLWVIIGGFGKS